MKISRFSYLDLLVSWLFVYLSSKLLWDSVPYVFELLSLAVFAFCAVCQLFGSSGMNLHKTNLFITFIIFSVYIIANGILYSIYDR